MSPTNLFSRWLLAATAVLAVAGLYGGLVRVGVPLPYAPAPAQLHGLIMMQGVFGTLVPLERAVALRRPVWLVAPTLSVLATAGLLAGLPPVAPMLAYVLAATLFCAMSLQVVRLQPAAFTLALLLGAGCLLVGAIAAMAGDVGEALPWWLGFLVLTVAAERLELSRFIGHGRGSIATFLAATATLLAGCAVGFDGAWGSRLFGLGLVLLSLWLWRHDIALRTVRSRGQARFMAASILCGHTWLAVAGGVGLLVPDTARDALIHAVTIGFTLSMVMGHALVILPAVAGLRLRYSPSLFAPLAILQAAAGSRVLADLWLIDCLWVSGLLTVLAPALFATLLARSSPTRPAG